MSETQAPVCELHFTVVCRDKVYLAGEGGPVTVYSLASLDRLHSLDTGQEGEGVQVVSPLVLRLEYIEATILRWMIGMLVPCPRAASWPRMAAPWQCPPGAGPRWDTAGGFL